MLMLDSSIVWCRAGLKSAWIMLTDQPAGLLAAPACSHFSTVASLPPRRPQHLQQPEQSFHLQAPSGSMLSRTPRMATSLCTPLGGRRCRWRGRMWCTRTSLSPWRV